MVELLISQEKYLEAGVHIGTRSATREMRKFVYKIRRDKLSMLNVEQIDKRIREVAKLLANYEPSKIAVIASRVYAIPAAKKFAEITGAKIFDGRFVPGTFTNPSREEFFEPVIVFVCDPRIEKQALVEATELGLPAFGLADTDNTVKYLDYFIPCNNKGKKAVPLIFYLLTREYMKEKGMPEEEFKYSPADFELGGEQPEEAPAAEEIEEGEEIPTPTGEKEEVKKPKRGRKKKTEKEEEVESKETEEKEAEEKIETEEEIEGIGKLEEAEGVEGI